MELQSVIFRFLSASIALIGMMSLHQSAYATCPCSTSSEERTEEIAEALVNRFWTEVKNANVKGYSKLLAKGFQGINIDGIYTRKDQITGLKNLTVTSFKINHLIASKFDNTLVISYHFHAEGQGIVSGPSIDIWQREGFFWKQISHSYVPFNPI